MTNELTDKDLCVALSDLFVDTETNYQTVVKIAKNFDLQHVEVVLLDWVAPVLHGAFFSVAPEWAGYEADWLWDEVQKVITRDSKAGYMRKIMLKIRRYYMTNILKNIWQEFIKEYQKQRNPQLPQNMNY